ncbi:unnamed protein product, partial [Oppiella nova]
TDIIKLIVFHRNLFGLADEFLGQTSVPLNEFDIYERPKSRWYELEGRSHKKTQKFRGEIEIRVTFVVKNIPNIKHSKKRNSLVHQSLLDIRGALKGDQKSDKHESKVSTSGRKFSMSDNMNKMPKFATRSISFKLDAFNTRRKSLVDKFLKRHDSSPQETTDEMSVAEESVQSVHDFQDVHNDVISEEMSQSQEEVRQMGRNTDNKIVIEVKSEFNGEVSDELNDSFDETNDTKTETQLKDNEVISDFETNIKINDNIETRSNISSESKSSPWKPLKGSLKKAFSSNNLLFLSSSSNKPVPKLPHDRDRSLTSPADDVSPQSEVAYNHRFHPQIPSPIVNDTVLRQTNRQRILAALKKSERRHTIDINEILVNAKHPSVAVEKRATQASPDSLYSSFESLINRKQSKTDYRQKYEGLNK